MTNSLHRWRSYRLMGALWLLAVGVAQPLLSQSKPATAKSPAAKPSTLDKEKTDPLRPLLQQAGDAIDKQDFSAALAPLQKYIAERPAEAYPHFQLGYAYARLRRATDARSEFSRAIELDPKMAEAQLNLGLVLMDIDAKAAAEAFARAAELQPDQSRPRFLTGFALERSGAWSEAANNYRSALSLSSKDYEYNFALARAAHSDTGSVTKDR